MAASWGRVTLMTAVPEATILTSSCSTTQPAVRCGRPLVTYTFTRAHPGSVIACCVPHGSQAGVQRLGGEAGRQPALWPSSKRDVLAACTGHKQGHRAYHLAGRYSKLLSSSQQVQARLAVTRRRLSEPHCYPECIAAPVPCRHLGLTALSPCPSRSCTPAPPTPRPLPG